MSSTKNNKSCRQRVKKQVERKYMSLSDAARLTGITRQSWSVWAREGRLASVKLGKRILLPISEVDRLIAEGMRTRSA